MAKFIAISGPSVTGKSSLVEYLSSHQELKDAIISPDFHALAWNDLVNKGIFLEFTDITDDSGYMCCYLYKVIDSYNQYIEEHRNFPGLVILDGCWIDLTVYAYLNMWYLRTIKSVQEDVFNRILKYSNEISKVYFTKAADEKYPIDKYRLRGKMTTFRTNRPLEITLYKVFSALAESSVSLDNAEIAGDSLAILSDLKKVGYL